MKRKAKAGLLPLYLKLYDECSPGMRKGFEPFLEQVVGGLEREGVEVIRAPVCRLEKEFREAARLFGENDADIIVALHLAYSPSLESADVLCRAGRPLLLLDTTMDHEFGRDADPERISYDHGIHGVQDLASVLRRRGKHFEIVAGHVTESEVLHRAAELARAARGARALRATNALRVGYSFPGMGDFAVAENVLERALGVRVDQMGMEGLAREVEALSDGEIEEELSADRENFCVHAPEDVHRRSVRVGLGLRRCLERGNYDAFSMNFLAFGSKDGPVNTVPFLEACKAMARGVGYAGEGDVLTASLVGALSVAFGRTTFTEMFCPDWKGNSLFLSHMGEINPEVAAEKPMLCERPFPYTDAENPAILACAPAPGPAVLVNLSSGPKEAFRLIVARVRVLEDASSPAMRDKVRGWIEPSSGVAEFLEAYSISGGTHHSALVLGERSEAVAAFGRFAGLEVRVL